jgi:hypothetical protein
MNYYKTVAQMKLIRPTGGTLAFCEETKKTYYYEPDATTYNWSNTVLPTDDLFVFVTGFGGDTRWISTEFKATVCVVKDSQQAVNTTTATITWEDVKHDNCLIADLTNNRIIIPRKGFYLINCIIRSNTQSVIATYTLRVQRNGSDITYGTTTRHSTTNTFVQMYSQGTFPLNAGDLLTATLETTNNMSINSNAVTTYFEVVEQ